MQNIYWGLGPLLKFTNRIVFERSDKGKASNPSYQDSGSFFRLDVTPTQP